MEKDQNVMRSEVASGNSEEGAFWFCVLTHPKHEHIAAAGLEKVGGFEVFNPQIRFRRATRRGPVWFTESAFSGYIFSRFNLQRHLDVVRYSACVSKVVHFSSGYPSIPDIQMEELRAIFGSEETLILSHDLGIGDTVRIVGGAFHDLIAVVQRVLPAKQRALALLEFLGQMTTVELALESIVVEERFQPLDQTQDRVEVFARGRLRSV